MISELSNCLLQWTWSLQFFPSAVGASVSVTIVAQQYSSSNDDDDDDDDNNNSNNNEAMMDVNGLRQCE